MSLLGASQKSKSSTFSSYSTKALNRSSSCSSNRSASMRVVVLSMQNQIKKRRVIGSDQCVNSCEGQSSHALLVCCVCMKKYHKQPHVPLLALTGRIQEHRVPADRIITANPCVNKQMIPQAKNRQAVTNESCARNHDEHPGTFVVRL